jgi:5-methyltetrahydrofolate--homocysteine methyltransferase
MIKAVADRLAEAFTELMHFKLRTELWGYSTEAFNNQQLIQEKFDGIRPAPVVSLLKNIEEVAKFIVGNKFS